MTHAECEIVANAGVQLREIAERLTLPPNFTGISMGALDFIEAMDAAALSISEVYGQLSALPIEVETPPCPLCGGPVKDGYQYHASTCGWVKGVTSARHFDTEGEAA